MRRAFSLILTLKVCCALFRVHIYICISIVFIGFPRAADSTAVVSPRSDTGKDPISPRGKDPISPRGKDPISPRGKNPVNTRKSSWKSPQSRLSKRTKGKLEEIENESGAAQRDRVRKWVQVGRTEGLEARDRRRLHFCTASTVRQSEVRKYKTWLIALFSHDDDSSTSASAAATALAAYVIFPLWDLWHPTTRESFSFALDMKGSSLVRGRANVQLNVQDMSWCSVCSGDNSPPSILRKKTYAFVWSEEVRSGDPLRLHEHLQEEVEEGRQVWSQLLWFLHGLERENLHQARTRFKAGAHALAASPGGAASRVLKKKKSPAEEKLEVYLRHQEMCTETYKNAAEQGPRSVGIECRPSFQGKGLRHSSKKETKSVKGKKLLELLQDSLSDDNFSTKILEGRTYCVGSSQYCVVYDMLVAATPSPSSSNAANYMGVRQATRQLEKKMKKKGTGGLGGAGEVSEEVLDASLLDLELQALQLRHQRGLCLLHANSIVSAIFLAKLRHNIGDTWLMEQYREIGFLFHVEALMTCAQKDSASEEDQVRLFSVNSMKRYGEYF